MALFSNLRSNVALGYKKIIGRVAPSLTGAVNRAKGVATAAASRGASLSASTKFMANRVPGLVRQDMYDIGNAANMVYKHARAGYNRGGIGIAAQQALKGGRRALGQLGGIPFRMNDSLMGAGVGAAYGLGTRDDRGHRFNIGRGLSYGMLGAGAGAGIGRYYRGANTSQKMLGAGTRGIPMPPSAMGNQKLLAQHAAGTFRSSFSSVSDANAWRAYQKRAGY